MQRIVCMGCNTVIAAAEAREACAGGMVHSDTRCRERAAGTAEENARARIADLAARRAREKTGQVVRFILPRMSGRAVAAPSPVTRQ